MPILTLLLLSGGGHTGCNVMASLASRRQSLRLVATSDIADEPSLYEFDAVYLAPRLAANAAGFECRVLEIIARENPALVVPCRDEDVVWLAGLRERRPELGAQFLCGSRDIAELANDKWLSYEFARAHGLPFVPSLCCVNAEDAEADVDAFVGEHGLPLVAKPRQGANSSNIVLLATRAQALRAMARPDYLLQKHLGPPQALQDYLSQVERDGVPLLHNFEGIKRSLQVLIGPNGRAEAILCTRNWMIARNARSVALDHEPEPRRIAERCAAVFAERGWRGPLNIQCQPSAEGELLIHEFNARFTGATAARWQIGHDEVGSAIAAFAGHRLEPAPSVNEGVVVREGLVARAANGRDIRALTEHREWVRDRSWR